MSCKRLTDRSLESLTRLEQLHLFNHGCRKLGCHRVLWYRILEVKTKMLLRMSPITDRGVRYFIKNSKSSFHTLYHTAGVWHLAQGVNQRSGTIQRGLSLSHRCIRLANRSLVTGLRPSWGMTTDTLRYARIPRAYHVVQSILLEPSDQAHFMRWY